MTKKEQQISFLSILLTSIYTKIYISYKKAMPPKQPPFTLPAHFLSCHLLLSCFIFSCQQVCNHQDQSALLAFSENISTSSSLPLNWSSQVSCCRWEGVECDIYGRVTHLQLPSRGLKGLISSSIISLTNLRMMDLSSNSISGSIPQQIGKLLYLEKLHLFGNNLSGPIPSSLMNCTHLVEIFLRDNLLNGDISKLDFSKLAQLQKLDLRNNSFNGTLPESIYSCKSLIAYRVELNNITDQISPKIVYLKSLSFLSIAQNSFSNITMTLRVLAKCKNLTTLFLSSNFYGESLPVHRNFISSGEFPKLQFLNLRNCMFAEGPIPNWLSNLRSLCVLNLEGNRLTGKVPNSLGTLPNLFRLNLNNNSLFGEFPLSLCQLPSLISQDAEANPKLSQFELPVFFSIVNTYIRSKVDNYYGLGLSYNAFSGNIPKEIGNLQNLQQLYLNNNHFSGPIPISISKLIKLEYLDLSTNNLTGEIPTSLASLSFLSHFNVSYNHLEGPIPTGGQFDSFEKFSFEGNPGLCGQSLKHPGSCSNIPATSRAKDRHGKHQFLDGLFVGFASGFSSILLIVASYVWFNYCKRRLLSSRRG